MEENDGWRYVESVVQTVEAYGGMFLASVPEVEVLEGEWPLTNRLVLLRFPTTEQAREWYDSEQYAPRHRIREQSSRTNFVFFEGD